MPCPSLDELPAPPPGKKGWPWTEVVQRRADPGIGAEIWPRITVVTASYNQGEFIEETIRSVLLQGYPALEYIVIDGGSSDNSVEIIKKYAPWLSYWVSEKDRGQSHAINKGWKRSAGGILAWLNSDDVYYPNILLHVGNTYLQNPKKDFWIVFPIDYYDEERKLSVIDNQKPVYDVHDWILGKANPNQQGSFWSSELVRFAGYLNENLHYGMDVEFFMRLLEKGFRFSCDNTVVAAKYRQHGKCKWKLSLSAFQYEWAKVKRAYLKKEHPDYEFLDRQLRYEALFHGIRLAQDCRISRTRRMAYLMSVLQINPFAVFRRDCLAAILRFFWRLDTPVL